MKKPFDKNASYQPASFAFRDQAMVSEIISRYPKGFQRSAVMPLLDLAQRQVGTDGETASPPHGGWIPRAALDEIARIIDQPPIKVYEVATFYSMYNLAPVGRYHVQCCTTTPCWLQGSDAVVKACKDTLGVKMGGSTADGMFTLSEVECLGACVNAPMMQINDEYYEDLDAARVASILGDLKAGKPVKPGSQIGRQTSMATGGPTTLKDEAKKLGRA